MEMILMRYSPQQNKQSKLYMLLEELIKYMSKRDN